jgi:hypothetical protein
VTRVLTILGSGETSPTMVTPHQRLFARLGPEADAVAWTLVQRFYKDRHRNRSFGGFLTSWSQCVGYKWSSAGTRRTDRDIVAWVDHVRGMKREDVPLRARWFVVLCGVAPVDSAVGFAAVDSAVVDSAVAGYFVSC